MRHVLLRKKVAHIGKVIAQKKVLFCDFKTENNVRPLLLPAKANSRSFFFSRSAPVSRLHLLSSVRSHLQVPPLVVKRFPEDVGATVHLSQQLVVGGEVVDERAAEAQALQQGEHLHLQGAAPVHLGAVGLGDAQVFPQDDHVHLETDHETHLLTFYVSLTSASVSFKLESQRRMS